MAKCQAPLKVLTWGKFIRSSKITLFASLKHFSICKYLETTLLEMNCRRFILLVRIKSFGHFLKNSNLIASSNTKQRFHRKQGAMGP